MKIILLCFSLFAGASQAGPVVQTLETVESTPKEIGGLEFSVVSQAEWRPFFLTDNRDSVVLQLRITNRGTKPVVFPTYDTFGVVVTGPGGKETPLGGDRDATRITPNLLLQPGKGFSYPLSAILHYTRKPEAIKLEFEDGTGSQSLTPLPPGDYSLAVEVVPCHYHFDPAKLPAPLWAAKGKTEPLAFKVSLPAPPPQ